MGTGVGCVVAWMKEEWGVGAGGIGGRIDSAGFGGAEEGSQCRLEMW